MFKAKAPDGSANLSGPHIKEYRLTKELSLREMAAKLQIGGLSWDHSTLARVESGERAVNDVELKQLSTILKVSIKKLTE